MVAASAVEQYEPQPQLVCNPSDFVLHLDRLRRRAARGAAGKRVGLDRLAAVTGIPRSSVHSYLTGVTLPDADRLDALVMALGSSREETREWAYALERVMEAHLEGRRWSAEEDLTRLPTANARVRSQRARGLAQVRDAHGQTTEPDAGPCVLTAFVCATWTGTYVYADPSAAAPRAGYLMPGNNWFLGQARGGQNPLLGESVPSDVWLYSQGDVSHDRCGGWGWVPATAVVGVRSHAPLPGVPWLPPTG